MVHKVWGQSDHPSGLGGIPVQILALSFHILGHHSPTRTPFHPKTRWQYLKKRGAKKVEIQPSPDLLFKTQDDLVREMGQDGVSDQLLGRFAPFLLQ
jgi:hypothetical protein